MTSQITFNPDSGDLGRAELRPISPLELQVIAPHIAHILECLHISELSKLPFKYAFEFPIHVKNEVLMTMNSIKLPSHVDWYESDGRKLFEMRGPSGGIVTGLICYLITKELK